MTGRFFSYQIFWKEYRQMRAFWLSVLGLTVMLQLIVFAVSAGTAQADNLYGLSLCFVVLYAMGCGATAFALEHENGTYDFLRALPTRGLPTFFSKVAFTAISAPLLFIATLSSATIISQHHYAAIEIAGFLFVWSVGSLVFFVWATLFSLLLRHAVKAAIFGGLGAVLSVALFSGLLQGFTVPENASFVIAVVGMLVLTAALDVWLAALWYREAYSGPTSDRRHRRRREELDATAGTYELELLSSKGSTFGHLVWLEWRQSRSMILILTGMVVLLALGLLWFGAFFDVLRPGGSYGTSSLRWLFDVASLFFYLSILAGFVIVPLAGANVFAGDQKQHQFRFLTDRGLSPKTVWWSRHPVWVVAVLIWVAIALVPFLFLVAGWSFSGPQDLLSLILRFAFPAALCMPMAYCFGQFCSMVFRSGILCGIVAIVGSILLAQWAFAMAILGVPQYWSVLPIPVILLVATRVRTRGWMLESNKFASWLPVLLVLVVPSAAILSGVCLYRAYSLPLVKPGFNVAAFTAPASPEAQETARMYRRAHDLLSAPTGSQSNVGGGADDLSPEDAVNEWQHADRSSAVNEEALALVLEASRRADCDDLSKYFPISNLAEDTQDLSAAVRREGNRFQKEGDLDGAAEHYLAVLRMANQMYPDSTILIAAQNTELEALMDLAGWCTQPGQTKERILKALRSVEELTSQPAPWDNAIKADYVRLIEIIEGDMDDMFEWAGPDPREVAPALMIYWMPWERERARHALRMVTSSELETYQQVRSSLTNGYQILLPTPQLPLAPISQIRMTPDAWLVSRNFAWASEYVVSTELFRRSTRIKMALAAWQLDHESLPKSLEELKGEYLAEVPVDPFAGEPFVYFPKGVREPIACYSDLTGEATAVVEADKPFFWSSGPEVFVVQVGDLPPTRKYQLRRGAEMQKVALPQQVWAAGRIFPIPQPR